MRTRTLASARTRKVALTAAVGLLATVGVAVTPGAAHADPILRVDYPVNGTTFIKKTNSTMNVGPATLKSTLDLGTGDLSADLALPPANGSFKQFGLIPVETTTEFIQDGPTRGKVDSNTGAVTSTSRMTLKLTRLKVAGIPMPLGDHCQTGSPAVINLKSEADWSVLKGGTLSGTYTIPNFENCLLATPLINITVPGPDNTITLKLGAATVPPAS